MQRKNSFSPSVERKFPLPGNPILVEVTRGNAVESRHEVHAVLSDAAGKLHGVWGNPDLRFHARSAVKTIQALGFLSAPGIEQCELTQKEISLACASHNGEADQVAVAEKWLTRIGFGEKNLECGTHEPHFEPALKAMILSGKSACPLHNNCSGKHTGMLLGTKLLGMSPEGYSNYDHPYQERLRQIATAFFDLDFHQLSWGIDGCGIPTYALPLKNLALAGARIANPKSLDSQIQKALQLATSAIVAEPRYIAGTDRLCTEIVEKTHGKAIVKVGAEGIYLASFPELGLGLALKCSDGSFRAVEMVLANFLQHLKITYPGLETHSAPSVKRWGGEVVGEIRLAGA